MIDNPNIYLNDDLVKEAEGLPLSLDDILQDATEDEENGGGSILQSQSNQFEYDDEDDEDEDEERKAAVQAAMMGIATPYNQSKGRQEQGRSLDIAIDEEDEKDDGLGNGDWRKIPAVDEQLVKVESEDEEDYKLLDSHSPTITRSRINHDRGARQSTTEPVRTESEARIPLQASHLLEGQPGSSELFMRDKPGVAGLPIRGPNSAESPVYVNPKQYDRIMKRRVARARLEEMGRLSRERKPYLHESRHKHAVRRPRGPRGRFLTKDELAERGDYSAVDTSL